MTTGGNAFRANIVGGESWLRSLAQPVTYLGVVMLAAIFCGLTYLLIQDKENATRDARREGENLVRIFEQSISRSFRSADNSILQLRRAYQSSPESVDLNAWVSDPELKNDLAFQISITDEDGKIIASSYGSAAVGIDIRNLEHFQVHVGTLDDRLFISRPITLRTSGRQAVILSRRLHRPDGSFNGILSVMIGIAELEKYYQSIDLGRDGFVSLMGLDGVIRARGANGQSRWDLIGKSFPNAGVLRAVAHSDRGTYWTDAGTRPTGVEDLRRLLSYRKVDGFPLVAVVGLAEDQIFSQAQKNARIYWAIAGLLTAGILIAIGFGAARARKLSATSSSLARTNMWLETALENMSHGLCMFDSDQRLIVCNTRYGEMYGLTPDQVRPGTNLHDILKARVAAGACTKDADEYVVTRLAEAFSWEGDEIINELRDGRVLSISRKAMPDGGSVAVHQDITLQKRNESEILYLAHHDGLTDLANRALFQQHVGKALDRLKLIGAAFNILTIDLDHFKDVNDTLGHAAGDDLVRQVAERLKTCLPENDLVARIGGDEFAILQAVSGDQRRAAEVLADRILEEIASPYNLDGHQAIVQTSIGIVLAPADGDNTVQLLKNADLALYKAKADGRNTFRFFDPEMGDEARARFDLERDLRNSIMRGEFELHYQPQVDIERQEVNGVEALVRWNHPRRGIVMPDAFIPLAESTGLIIPLGRLVLRKACSEALYWPASIKVAVNLSPIEFKKGDIVEAVASVLQETGLPPERLELEITESVLLQKNEFNLLKLHQLRGLGVSIALDDFGTGYSSLSYLQMFPFDKIKIDKSFIADMSHRSDCAAIVCAVTGLARSLDVTTTAEGVETEEQFRLLRAAGCRQAQGYLFGRPVPAAALQFERLQAQPSAREAIA